MTRAVWSGSISFGLVVLPVRLVVAVTEHDVPLHEVHVSDGSRIRHRRVCQAEGREVAQEDVGRGYELPNGRMVVLREEDLDLLPLPARRTMSVLGFVDQDDVDPVMYRRAYYVEPSGPEGQRPYELLVAALARTGKIAVGKVALRGRERLAVLRPRRGVLRLHTMYWPDEVVDPGDLTSTAPLSDRELDLAETLVNALTGVEEELHDEYAAALEQLVDAKMGGGELAPPAEPAPVVDLVAALEESIRVARPGDHP